MRVTFLSLVEHSKSCWCLSSKVYTLCLAYWCQKLTFSGTCHTWDCHTYNLALVTCRQVGSFLVKYGVIFFASQTTIGQNPEFCSHSLQSSEEEAMKKGKLHLNRSYFLKHFRIGPYELCMFAMVSAATLARFVLIYFNWPLTNSDEGNMGLLAMHVAYRGELPIFFYGLPYMGPLEGYIAAPSTTTVVMKARGSVDESVAEARVVGNDCDEP